MSVRKVLLCWTERSLPALRKLIDLVPFKNWVGDERKNNIDNNSNSHLWPYVSALSAGDHHAWGKRLPTLHTANEELLYPNRNPPAWTISILAARGMLVQIGQTGFPSPSPW